MKTFTIILILAVATSCRSSDLDNVEIDALVNDAPQFSNPPSSESEITPVSYFPAVPQTHPNVEPYPTPAPPVPEYGPPAHEYGLPPPEYYHQSAPAHPLVNDKSPLGANKPYYNHAPDVPYVNKAPIQPSDALAPPPTFQAPQPVFQAAPPAFQAKAPLAPVQPQAVPMLPLLPLPPMPMMGD